MPRDKLLQNQPPIYYARRATENEKDARDLVRIFQELVNYSTQNELYNLLRLDKNTLRLND